MNAGTVVLAAMGAALLAIGLMTRQAAKEKGDGSEGGSTLCAIFGGLMLLAALLSH